MKELDSKRISLTGILTIIALGLNSWLWFFGVSSWGMLIAFFFVAAVLAIINLVILFKMIAKRESQRNEFVISVVLVLFNIVALIQPALLLFAIMMGIVITNR